MKNYGAMIKMPHEERGYDCCHEELLQDHSLKITALEAELNYKREKLEDLKKDNEKLMDKLDEIKDCMNKLIVKSNKGDTDLENRLVAIENEQKNINKKIEDNKRDSEVKTGQMYTKIGLIVTGISLGVAIIFHFI